MRILFDQGVPVPLRLSLTDHLVDTAYERNWSSLKNGDLLNEAERDGYKIFITTDQKLKYQQNLVDRKISIIVLLSTSWPRIQKQIDNIKLTIAEATPGSYREISI